MQKKLLFICLFFIVNNQLSAQTILGADVSEHQGSVNWQQAKTADGITFAWSKASDGLGTTYSTFPSNMVNGTNAGVVMGAYHFARPYEHSAIDEANYFLSVATQYIKAGYLPPALDIEDPSDHPTIFLYNYFSKASLTAWVQTWIATVQNATGITPIIYTDSYYAGFLNSSLNVYKLWIAKPNTSSSTPPTDLGSWGNAWAVKQYSWTGTVAGINPVDLDVFNGDINAFSSFIGENANAQANLTQTSVSFAPGTNALTVNVTVENTGTGDAGPSVLGYYLGKTAGAHDYLIGTSNVTGLSAGQSSIVSFSVNLCGMGIPDGAYYVDFDIDYLNAVSESSEADNDWHFNSPLQTINCAITATISNASIAPATICPGGNFVITDNVNASAALNVMLGASIAPTGTTNYTSDPSNDIAVSLPSGASSPTRSFTVPATTQAGTYDLLVALYKDTNGDGIIDAGDEQLGTLTKTGILTVTAQPTAVNVTGGGTYCNNAILSASGGDGGTIYWQGTTSGGESTATPSTSQTVTASGTYYFRSLNNCGEWGQEGSAIVTINNTPSVVTVSGSGTHCNNAILSASGGDGGTIYWQGTTSGGESTATPSTSQTVTASGTYYFSALNDCGVWGQEGSATVTITSTPSAVTVNGGGTYCDNTTLSASGGDGGTIYWQGTISGGESTATPSTSQLVTQSGTYYFRANNNCGWGDEVSATVVISTISAAVSISADATTICSGSSVTFTANNVNNIPSPNYQWQLNGASVGTNSSTYTNAGFSNGDVVACVISSSSSCVTGSPATSNSVTITVNPPPTASLNAVGTTVLTPGGSVVLQASSGTGYTYRWFLNNNEIPGFTGSTYTATQTGSYTVEITSNGCSTTSQLVSVTSQFTLPNTNFQLTVTSEACNGDSNGSISITAIEPYHYTATINANGATTPYSFTNTSPALISSLPAGGYWVCITVDSQPGYQQCDSVVITQPKPLSVYASVDPSNNDLNLSLSGGNQYTIKLNGELYTTSANNITLPLQAGDNNLEVTTDKFCQGTFTKIISILNRIVPYPVPFQNTLKLNLGNQNISNVLVEIHTVTDGQVVFSNKYVNQSGVLQLDLNNLKNGIYALHLNLNGTEKIFKIIKE